MSEPQVLQQSVLIDVEPVPGGSVQAKMPVDKTFRRYDQDQPMLLDPDRTPRHCRTCLSSWLAR